MIATGQLVLLGSGETTPTMVSLHQQVIAAARAALGDPLHATLLDTPYGFQENAAELTAKAVRYFEHHVRHPVTPIAAARIEDADPVAVERALDAVRRSGWVFAGPGSPTYAVRQWTTAPFADALADVVDRGGAVVLASAAAVTAGVRTIPVYEIYKAGWAVRWAEGLDLVRRLTGWACAVVPHHDNAEGGTHDTRYCYLGERRLRLLEDALPDGAWVLGVDEHTACVIDRADGVLAVHGRGAVHLRVAGEEVHAVPAGESVPLAAVPDLLAGRPAPRRDPRVDEAAVQPPPALGEVVRTHRAAFDAALDVADAGAATAAALAVEQLVRDWAADPEQGGDADQAVAALRGMITRLGDVAGAGMHDHLDLVRPVIETLVHVREDARARRAFEVADHIRGHMDATGIRVQDTGEGTRWEWDEPAI